MLGCVYASVSFNSLMLCVLMLIVVILNVIMLNVVAPDNSHLRFFRRQVICIFQLFYIFTTSVAIVTKHFTVVSYDFS